MNKWKGCNKIARKISAMLTRNEDYKDPVLAGAA